MAVTRIYQFADLPLILKNQAINMDYSTTSEGEVSNFLFSHKKYTSSDRYITSPTEITFEGVLINDNYINVNSLEQRLRSLVGFPENLICYLLPDDYPTFLDNCVCEGDCGCELIWINAQAKLKEVSVETDEDFVTRSITLTFTLLDYFAPLNPLYYEFDGTIETLQEQLTIPTTVDGFKDLLSCFPTCEELFNDNGCVGCKFFSKRNYDFYNLTFNTLLWEAISSVDCCNNFSLGTGFDSLPINGINQTLTIDKNVWGAPPSSLYAFQSTKEAGDGVTINIKITYNDGTNQRQENTSIGFSVINSLMVTNGHGTFGSTIYPDYLYVGNINYYINSKTYRPAFVVRNNVVLSNVHPLVRFPSFSPGQIYSGKNKIFIGAKDTDNIYGNYDGFNYAYSHNFRRI